MFKTLRCVQFGLLIFSGFVSTSANAMLETQNDYAEIVADYSNCLMESYTGYSATRPLKSANVEYIAEDAMASMGECSRERVSALEVAANALGAKEFESFQNSFLPAFEAFTVYNAIILIKEESQLLP
jgi:hypothetical protein